MEHKMSMNDEIFEILLRNALIAKYENEVTIAKREAIEHSYSDIFKKKIKKISNSINRSERIKTTGKIFKKTVVIAASILGIVFSGLLTQPEVYAAVEKVIKSIFSTHDSYTYQGNSSESLFNKNMQLGYIPEGYDLRSIFYSDVNASLTYESSDEKYIYFDYGFAENSLLSIDNERHNCYELNFNDTTYYFYEAIEEGDFNTLIWYKDDYYYSIDAQLSSDMLVEIAKNVLY